MAEDVAVGDVSSGSHQAGSGALYINSHPVCTSSMKGFLHGTCFSAYDSRAPRYTGRGLLHATSTIHVKKGTNDTQAEDKPPCLLSLSEMNVQNIGESTCISRSSPRPED